MAEGRREELRSAEPSGRGKAWSNRRAVRHDYVERGVKVGFFTDATLCIGCKACEVACKEWNDVPSTDASQGAGDGRTGRSYDFTGELGANTWRHVQFVEGTDEHGLPTWSFHSNVCKHCERAGCLEACPTGAIVRTEVGSVLVQDDVCNGCGYCVVSCPFGVVDRRADGVAAPRGAGAPGVGGAHKCTFCIDRQSEGRLPACATACPTDSILFGPLDALEEHAVTRIDVLRRRGREGFTVYDGSGGSVGRVHAMSLLPPPGQGPAEEGAAEDSPAGSVEGLWGLPTSPDVPADHLPVAWSSAAVTVLVAILLVVLAWGTPT